MYLDGVETKFNTSERNEDGCGRQQAEGLFIFAQKARQLGGSVYDELSDSDFEKVRLYVLNNCEEVQPFHLLHKLHSERPDASSTESQTTPEFDEWLLNYVSKLHKENPSTTTKQLLSLARGPDRRVTRYTGCVTNGLRFHNKAREMCLRTQNSGVVVNGDNKGKSILFYGVLKDIIEVSYLGDNRVLLFKCDWWNIGSLKTGIHKDVIKFVNVNVTKTWYKEDPFVLASQAQQVFYLDDKKLGKNWRVIQKSQPRSVYDIPKIDLENNEFEVHQEHAMQGSDHPFVVEDRDVEFHINVVDMLHTDTNIVVEDNCRRDEENCIAESDDGGDTRDDDLIDDDTDE